jgi:hypothetical protein
MFGFSNYTFKLDAKMSDDWVYVGSYKNHSQYYKKSSVTIDEKNNIINVLVNNVKKNKNIVYLQNTYSIKEPNYIKFNQQLKWYLLNYKKLIFAITRITDYSKSGNVLLDTKYQPKWLHNIFPIKWDDIIPDSSIDFFLNKLLQDYNIWNDFSADIKNNNNYKLSEKSSNMMSILNLLIGSITKNFTSSSFKF